MISADLTWSERWQVVAYVRTLQVDGLNRTGAEPSDWTSRLAARGCALAGGRPDEWLTYSGSLDGRRYTPLAEINPANVSKLRVRWIKQFDTNESRIEATPLVVDGVIFTTEPPANVVALDARSGEVIWTYRRSIPSDLRVCCGRVNRGLAILGHLLFLGSIDGYLVAIDANTGRMVWQTKVADSFRGLRADRCAARRESVCSRRRSWR